MADDPLLRIVRGTPTAEEIAALVGVVVSRPQPGPAASPPVSSTWARSARPHPTALRVGPGAWRTSALPR